MGIERRARGGTALLGLVNVAVYLWQLVARDVRDDLALPAEAADVWERPWTIFTVMFFHEHIVHLAVMLAALVLFAGALERSVGALRVVGVYLASGAAASLAAVAAAGPLDIVDPAVGSSAAVFGVVAAFAALHPHARLAGGKSTHWLAAIVVANVVLFPSLPLGSVAHLASVATGLVAGRALRDTAGADVAGVGQPA